MQQAAHSDEREFPRTELFLHKCAGGLPAALMLRLSSLLSLTFRFNVFSIANHIYFIPWPRMTPQRPLAGRRILANVKSATLAAQLRQTVAARGSPRGALGPPRTMPLEAATAETIGAPTMLTSECSLHFNK